MSTKVFISSTSQDLHDYRAAAIEICNRLNLVPIAMEYFEAMGKGATEGSKQKLDNAELYVGIIAHRYGYVEEGYLHSVTEIEFDYALERGLERLCFLVDPAYPWPPDAIDYKQIDKLNAFKSRVSTSLIRSQFTTIDDFKLKLMQALVEWNQRQSGDVRKSESENTEVVGSSTNVPPFPSLLIGREKDIHDLKSRLGVGAPRRSLCIIRGWPGIGKTTLVSHLAYDPEILRAFPDGILWASVGEHPNTLNELAIWGRALGIDIGEAKTLQETMQLLRAQLRDKSALLIIDDVWESDKALPFRVGGRECTTLVTTRFGDVARELATISADDIYVLGNLSDEASVALLSRVAPSVVDAYQTEMYQLGRDLEGLPLALRVAGRLLEAEASAGFDILDSFKAFRENARILLHTTAPDDRFDPYTGTTPTVQLLLQRSTDRLDSSTRDCFAFLGAFAPKPATFDLPAMQAVWMVDDPKSIATKLVDRGLLEPIPAQGRFWMHQVLVLHAKSMLTD